MAFCASGQSDQARRLFEAILKEAPWHVASASNLASLEAEAGDFERSRETIQSGLRSHPSVAFRFGAAAHAACNRQAWGHAQDFAIMALSSSPDDGAAWMALAETLVRRRLWNPAERCFRRALDLTPDDAVAKHAFSLMLLTLGRFEEGFHFHKAIRHLEFARSALGADAPYWEGQNLAHKTLLVVARLGLGDTIQYARYLPELRRRAAQLKVQVQPALARLLDAPSIGLDPGRYDYCTAFDELPGLVAGVAWQPYLMVPDEAAAAWRRRIRQKVSKVVGIVYAGNPRQAKHAGRSIDPNHLRPLLAVPGIRFVSLQVDGHTDLGIAAFGPDFQDLFDTACAIRNLDLLISVDTSVAHLAGAMGRPTWIMLPYVPDYRWLLDRADSPWYPSVRLFRQDAARDYVVVVDRIRGELAGFELSPKSAM